MSPTFDSGDFVFVRRTFSLQAGDLVVVNHPSVGTVVKRIKSICKDYLFLVGDNKRLNSSICDVPLPISLARGRVFAVYRFPLSVRLCGTSAV